jgi:hypothetical protein
MPVIANRKRINGTCENQLLVDADAFVSFLVTCKNETKVFLQAFESRSHVFHDLVACKVARIKAWGIHQNETPFSEGLFD